MILENSKFLNSSKNAISASKRGRKMGLAMNDRSEEPESGFRVEDDPR